MVARGDYEYRRVLFWISRYEEIMDFAKIIDIVVKQPWAIFVVLSGVYGYLYYEQNQDMQLLLSEVGGLRAEQTKMNEIIQLKVELVKAGCK